jgi:2-polyprenyl-6-methoxyphenol hydroxylase-like FAD-dependent oxidoreductase
MKVIIIGAGPSGLMCALVLAQQQVNVEVIERAPTAITQTRAMFIQMRTLELWDKLGVSSAALERGSQVNAVSLWSNGKKMGSLSFKQAFAKRAKFPHALGLPQDQTQALLLEALAAFPHVRVRWGTTLNNLEQSLNKVKATLQTGESFETLIADYLVGADGASSTVRKLLGINMPGFTYDLPEFGADVELPFGLPRDEMISSSSMARGLSVMPIGQNRFRVFGTITPALQGLLGPNNDTSHVQLADVQRWFQDIFPDAPSPTKLYRAFAYRIHKRVAERFREHRVFLIGDAAHMNAPAGGQGINLGMGDGFNLGWKLALVCRGFAYPSLLDSYEAEREPVTRRIVQSVDFVYKADAVTGSPLSQVTNWLSSRMTSLLLHVPTVQKTIANLVAQTWISYRESPLGADFGPKRGLRVGERVPTLPTLEALGVQRLGFHLLYFAIPQTDPTKNESQLFNNLLPATFSRFQVPITIHHVKPSERDLYKRFGVKQSLFVLIRPDGHIIFRGQTQDDVPKLANLLHRFFTPHGYSVTA